MLLRRPSRRSWTAGPRVALALLGRRGVLLQLVVLEAQRPSLRARPAPPRSARAAVARRPCGRAPSRPVRADASGPAARRRPSPRRRAACAAPPPRVGGRRLEEPAAPRRRLELLAPRRGAALPHLERTATCSRCRHQVPTRCAASARREDCSESWPAPARGGVGCVDGHGYSSVPEGGGGGGSLVLRHRAPGWLTPRNCSAAARICGPNSLAAPEPLSQRTPPSHHRARRRSWPSKTGRRRAAALRLRLRSRKFSR